MSEEYSRKMSEQVRTAGVDLSFVTTRTHNHKLTNDQTDLPISQNAASVRSTYHVLREANVVSSTAHGSLSTYQSGNIRSIQYDLGGHLMPTQAIKMDDDGSSTLYSHNLQAWNMWRNHAFGSNVDASNFDTTESKKTPLGSHADAVKQRPIRRVYGTWVCNGQRAATGAMSYLGTDANSPQWNGTGVINTQTLQVKTVGTLTFIPDDPREVAQIPMGQRCKMGLSAFAVAENSADNAKVLVKEEIVATKLGTGKALGYNEASLTASDAGLDRFFKDSVTISGQTNYSHSNANLNSQSIMYAGAPQQVLWGYGPKVALHATEDAARWIGGLGVVSRTAQTTLFSARTTPSHQQDGSKSYQRTVRSFLRTLMRHGEIPRQIW